MQLFALVSIREAFPPVLESRRAQECRVAWPSGPRRWIKAPVSSGAWVRVPPLPVDAFGRLLWLRKVMLRERPNSAAFTFLAI